MTLFEMIGAVTGSLLLVAAWILFMCRYTFWRPRRPDAWPRVLMYHAIGDVVPEGMRPELCVRPAAFEKQVRLLKKRGYTFLKASQVPGCTAKKPVAITFDDGFADNAEAALPILRKYGAAATIFVARESDVPGARMLSAEQLAALAAEPLIELGAHTLTHINMSKHEAPVVEAEVRGSLEYVQGFTGKPCTAFAYPYGRFDDKDVAILKAAGVACAFTVRKGVEPVGDPYRIRRSGVLRSCDGLQFRILLRSGRYKV